MKILVACEYSGTVRDAFKRKGHDAWSCDILPTDIPGKHIQGNVLDILDNGWDMMIAHPPCTHLAVSGARWFTEGLKPRYLQDRSLTFVRKLMKAPIPRICIENPVSIISSRIRKSDQMINPYEFGHREFKRTCLWLDNLPKLKPITNLLEETKKLPKKISNRINYIPRGPNRGHLRSKFFKGFANAMANQWGSL